MRDPFGFKVTVDWYPPWFFPALVIVFLFHVWGLFFIVVTYAIYKLVLVLLRKGQGQEVN